MAFMITASSSMLLSTAARSQTYKADFATKVVLAGAATDIGKTITLFAPAVTGPTSFSLTLPSALPGGAGYILTAGTDGDMSWTDPASSIITLNGDVTGPSGSNTVKALWGTALADMSGAGAPTDAQMLIYNATSSTWSPVSLSKDATITNGGVLTLGSTVTTGNDIIAALDNSTDALTTASNLTTSGTLSSGGDATLGTGSGATANSFGTGNNAVDVMNTIGSTGTGSLTTINGGVSFTGAVSYTTAPTIPLPQGELFFGNSSGDAAAETMYGDATMAYDAAHGNFVTVSAASGTSGFTVTNLTQTNGALNNTGSLHTSGGDVNINTLVGSGNINIGDTTNAGNINIGNSGSTNAIAGTTGISGATTVTGTTNINNTGSAATTIGNSGSTNVIAGGTTIGAVTLSSPSALDASSGTLTVDAINSLYIITTPGTVTTIASASPTTGRIVELLNKSSGKVTLTYNVTSPANFELNGSDVLLGPNGSVSLIYDGTNWTVVQ